MMPDMSENRQPREAGGPDAGALRWWILPLLAAALSLYVLWMGETLAWRH
jgi:hypothetical protein